MKLYFVKAVISYLCILKKAMMNDDDYILKTHNKILYRYHFDLKQFQRSSNYIPIHEHD